MSDNFPRYYQLRGDFNRPIQSIPGELDNAIDKRRTYNPKSEKIDPRRPIVPSPAENIPDTIPTEWLDIS